MLEYEHQQQRLSELKPELEQLGKALDIEGMQKELEQLEVKTNDAAFWEDVAASQPVLQRQKQLSARLDSFKGLQSKFEDVEVLLELAQESEDMSVHDEIVSEIDSIEKSVQSQKLSTLLSGEYDNRSAILTFHAGAGGTEAQDWVEMLYRMYTRWAERHGYKYKVLDYLDGDEAGIKSASILIDGLNVYGYLRSEAGVHRLVRISPFDSSGRRHTSFASLEVMPEIDEDTTIVINDADLRVDTYRSGGAGGQHVNKTDSAVRLTHIPTGIVAACQNERSQHQNKEVAMKMLRSKLAEIKQREHLDRIEDIKGVQKEIAWGSQIRSYVFMPYTMAKDHRTDFEVGNISAVMDGEIDGFINAYLIQNRKTN